MNDSDLGLLSGAARLEELQQQRLPHFQLDMVSMSLEVEPEMRVLINFNRALMGSWTRNDKGEMIAHFEHGEACGTTAVDIAKEHTIRMVEDYRRRIAQRP